jgi:hypothetical protein
MGLCQVFRFRSESPEAVRACLHGLASSASLEERTPEFFVFSQVAGEPAFTLTASLCQAGSSLSGRVSISLSLGYLWKLLLATSALSQWRTHRFYPVVRPDRASAWLSIAVAVK